MGDFETLKVERREGVATIWLNRPERRNAMNPEMARELIRVLEALGEDGDVRALVLRGSGGHFCSGGDLTPGGEPPARPRSVAALTQDLVSRVYGGVAIALQRCAKRLIAAVEGTAAGAGANLAFGCDFVLAHEGARFCEIFVRRGLSLDLGGSWLLPRLVGLQKAKQLAFFGDWVEAREAERIGLVAGVFGDETFEDEVRAWSDRLAAQAPVAISLIKKSLNASFDTTLVEAVENEAVAQAMTTATDDFAEGMKAFLEKRKPRFTGG
jgi:2-(1,2-epoxy-1,2-dihydrophenyl)acetyl-CoA isomerase